MGATTLRMPDPLHEQLSARAKEEGRSLNDLVVEVLEREARCYRRRKVLRGMIQLSREIGKARVEPGDVTEDLRRLREERAARG